MPPLIRVPVNMFKEVERMLHHRFWDKERERSNHASQHRQAGVQQAQHVLRAPGVAPRCLRNHDQIAWSGPPHDKLRAYVCLHCHGSASEDEIRDRGWEFETIPDWIIHEIIDADLARQAQQAQALLVPQSWRVR